MDCIAHGVAKSWAPAERLLWPGRAPPSASQLLAFPPGQEQASLSSATLPWPCDWCKHGPWLLHTLPCRPLPLGVSATVEDFVAMAGVWPQPVGTELPCPVSPIQGPPETRGARNRPEGKEPGTDQSHQIHVPPPTAPVLLLAPRVSW